MSKGEVIQLHVGQAGVQMANACWELYCLEHDITVDGQTSYPDCAYNTFFGVSSCGRIVPRLVMVDTEPTVIDEIRSGYYRHLFHPGTLISGKEDAANNFARGFKVIGPELIDLTMDTIRKVAETCSFLQGFILFRSIGGGTGSGLGSLILERLSDDYGRRPKFECEIFPSPSISPVIVEPYNAVLATHASMDFCNCVFLLDNEALYGVCATKLDVKTPTYTNLNRLIGQVISSLTAPLRFEGQANITFAELETNLVPYPRIHYPMVTYAPIVSVKRANFEYNTARHVTFTCFEEANQLVKCHPRDGQFMACVLLYRGDVSPTDVNSVIQDIKRTKGIKFANWAPTGFKFGINNQPPTYVPGGDLAPTRLALCMLSSNTAVREAWCRITEKFQRMFAQRAFVHHYVGEGLEEGYLTEAKNNLCTLVEDYVFVDEDPEVEADETDSLSY